MNLDEERRIAKENRKILVRKELEDSSHALANGIINITDDIISVKSSVDNINDNVSTLKLNVVVLDSTVSKLYKVVVGDIELKAEGLIQKDLNVNERISRVDERAQIRHAELLDRIMSMENVRIAALESNVTWMKGIGATILVAWGVFGDFVKKLIHIN